MLETLVEAGKVAVTIVIPVYAFKILFDIRFLLEDIKEGMRK